MAVNVINIIYQNKKQKLQIRGNLRLKLYIPRNLFSFTNSLHLVHLITVSLITSASGYFSLTSVKRKSICEIKGNVSRLS